MGIFLPALVKHFSLEIFITLFEIFIIILLSEFEKGALQIKCIISSSSRSSGSISSTNSLTLS